MKVGLFVVAALLIFAALSIRVGGLSFLTDRGAYDISVVVPNASGLDNKTTVEIAGIKVGEVKAIELEDARARIIMRIDKGVQIPVDSQIAIRTRGLLGAKYIEIIPGNAHREGPASSGPPVGAPGGGFLRTAAAAPGRSGAPAPDEPFIRPGGEIRRTQPTTDTDELVRQLSAIADDVKAVTASFRAALGGPEGQRQLREIVTSIAELSRNLNRVVAQNDQKIGVLVDNLTAFSRDLREISAQNREDLNATIVNFRRFSDTLAAQSPDLIAAVRSLSTNLDQLVKENRQNVGQSLENIRNAAARLDSALESVGSIAQKVDQGQGPLGRLVNDEQMGEQLSSAVTGLGELLGTADRLETRFQFRYVTLAENGDGKTAAGIELLPGPDRSYLLELVNNPYGRLRVNESTRTVVNPDGSTSTSSSRTVARKENELQVTFLVQKWWEDIGLRGGLIESTGGAGLMYRPIDNLDLTLDAFNFLRDGGPNLRAEARYTFLRRFHVSAGVENLLDDEEISGPPRTFFFGGGFFFADEDLKTLVRQAPVGSFQ
jgi:phospholipid/cholesterol/gamma-HCH transport system substrate-binding protein